MICGSLAAGSRTNDLESFTGRPQSALASFRALCFVAEGDLKHAVARSMRTHHVGAMEKIAHVFFVFAVNGN